MQITTPQLSFQYQPSRILRSFDANLFVVPDIRSFIDKHLFFYAAPTLWFSLPSAFHEHAPLYAFHSHSKYTYFAA